MELRGSPILGRATAEDAAHVKHGGGGIGPANAKRDSLRSVRPIKKFRFPDAPREILSWRSIADFDPDRSSASPPSRQEICANAHAVSRSLSHRDERHSRNEYNSRDTRRQPDPDLAVAEYREKEVCDSRAAATISSGREHRSRSPRDRRRVGPRSFFRDCSARK